MSDANAQKPVGYGHDKKGAAGGATKNDGETHVSHKGPTDTVAGQGHGTTAQTFLIDDREIDIRPGETIFRAARRLDIKLPHLCYSPKPGYRADGNCRVCMVEIEGERVLAASCIRTPAPGMKVKTQTDRAKTARRMVAELLLTDQPAIKVAHDPIPSCGRSSTARRSRPAASPSARRPRRTAAIPRWRSISTPASNAICVCAPAARSRSTT